MSRVRWLISVTLIVGGCVGSAVGSGAPAATPPGPLVTSSSMAAGTSSPSVGPPLGAVSLVVAGPKVLLLAAQGLYAVEHGNLTSLGATLPTGSMSKAIAAADSEHLVAASAIDGGTVVEYRSADGGQTWSAEGRQIVSAADGIDNLQVGVVGGQIAVLVNENSSSNVSYAMVTASADNGATWTVARAPTGGVISGADGIFWLVGGVAGDKVFTSPDGLTWRPVTIPIANDSWTADVPAMVTGHGVVLPITSHGSADSQVTFWATSDQGASWRSLSTVVAPHTEADTTIPMSITADGQWFAAWPDGSKVVSGTLGAAATKTVSPDGLPGNVYQIAAVSAAEGVAATAPDSCPNGKQSCVSTTVVVHTEDGGQTWSPIP
jgi:BNR/Asp-box repeat